MSNLRNRKTSTETKEKNKLIETKEEQENNKHIVIDEKLLQRVRNDFINTSRTRCKTHNINPNRTKYETCNTNTQQTH
jgi:ribosomal protein S25